MGNRGFYEPGFFHLRVNTEDELESLGKFDPVSLGSSWMPVFLHEYIHFLQDITTTHGLLNFIHWIEYLKTCNQQIREENGLLLQTPLKISEAAAWSQNDRLRKVFRGLTGKGKAGAYCGYESQMQEVEGGMQIPKYMVVLGDPERSLRRIHFGSIHLKEYMAHRVQSQFDPETEHEDIPYRLVEILMKNELPQLAEKPELVMALCDASLMDFHPARLFFEMVEYFKNNPNQIPRTVDSIYDLIDSKVKPDGYESLLALYVEISERAMSSFGNALSGEVYEGNVRWFETVLGAAFKWRSESRGFFSRLIETPRSLTREFQLLIRDLGIPFTTNSKNMGKFMPPNQLEETDVNPYYPKAFQAIAHIFHEGGSACSMFGLCEASPLEDLTNHDCHSQPWNRVNNEQLCPFAQMWKMWGLAGKLPVKGEEKD